MKVLVFNGSPKENSNTMILTEEFLKGINGTQTHQIEIIHVIKQNIQYCTGCLSCWMRQNGRCIMKDDMNALLDKIAQSDILIWSFPLYQYGMPGHMKTLFDRTIPFLKMQMYTSRQRVLHETVVDISRKKNIVICGCGFPYFEDNFTPLKEQMKNIFLDPCMLCIFESGLVTIPNPAFSPMKEKLFAALRNAGAEYDQTGAVSDHLLQQVQQPMIPNDMYIEFINEMVTQA